MSLDSLEGVGEVCEKLEGIVGAGKERVKMRFRKKKLVLVKSENIVS